MKTACEEAAEALEMRNFPPALPKRLRAEGRELKRLRKTLLLVDKWPITVKERKQVAKEIDRIQKARKAK